MEFLVFLAAYIIRRKLDNANAFAGDDLWRKGFAAGHRASPGKESSLTRGLLMIAVPALLLALAEFFSQGTGWYVVVHPFGFLLLIGLMGAPGVGSILQEYTDAWRRGDMQAAWHRVQNFLPAEERGAATSPGPMHRAVSSTLIGLIFERYFVVAFWYVIGGLWAAFAARALIALRDHWPQPEARAGFGRFASAASFLPAKLLILTFGVAGDLAGWLKGGKSAVLSPSAENRQMLMSGANSSLTGYELQPERFSEVHSEDWPDFGERSLTAVRELMNRSMLVWICALALMVIAGIA
jgi:AmpE protein